MLASLSPFEREMRALAQLADQVGIAHVLGTPEFAQLEKDDHVAAAIYRRICWSNWSRAFPPMNFSIARNRRALHGHRSGGRRQNLDDPHFAARKSFATIHHPELGRDLKLSRHGGERRSEAAFFLYAVAPPTRRAYRGSAEARVIKLTDNGFPASGKIDRKFAGTDEPRTRLTIQIGKGANIFPRAARDAPTQR